MSKRALKTYLKELNKEQLEEQVLDLFHRFKEVKTYYNFVFNPDEDKLIESAKTKISLEYFPVGKRKKAKMRRSIAQKHIKKFNQLGVDPMRVLDLMLYNIEIAQSYNAIKRNNQDSFYKSMLNSFIEAMDFAELHNMYIDFSSRIDAIARETRKQNWFNFDGFERVKLRE